MKKKLLVAASIATIGVGTLGVGIVNAQTGASSTGTSIVDKLVAKFGLKKADVQAVFDQEHTEREAQRLQKVSEKLAAGVKAGTITQAQSDAITAKIKEFQANRDANRAKFQSVTEAERKAAMDAEKTALDKWIADNKIPAEFARLLHVGGRGHGGPGMGKGDMTPPAN